MSDPRAPLALVLVVVLAALSVPPILMLIQSSFAQVGPDGTAVGWTMQHFRDLFSDPKLVGTIFASIVFAAGSACVSLLVGGVLSWLVERTDAPFKQLASLTAIISMGTPYILYVVAWLFLLGRVGPLNELYRMATGDTGVIFNVNSMAGMILIEGFLWSPLVFLMLSATFRAANADMEEAARISGASVAQTIRRVTLPLSMPSIIALALFVFIRAIEALEVPLLVGMPGNINLLTTDVYESTQQMPPDLGYSSAFALLLLVFVAVLFSLYGRISKNADRYQSVTGKAFRPRPFHLGRARGLAGAFIFGVFLIVLLLPLLALVWLSLLPYTSGFSLRILPFLNLDNYRAVLAHPYYLGLAVNTILVSAGAATFVVVITAVAGWLAARRGPGHWLIDQLATLPLVFPGIVMGVAVMQIVLYLPIPVYGTLWAIMIAYVIRYMPYGMRYSYSGVLQVHRELEEAAGVSGASLALTLRRVMMPLLSPALLASWIFVFLICSKELSVAVLLAGPKSQVIAVAMLDLWVNGQGGELSAFGLLWTVVIALVALVFLRFGQDRASGAFH
ncbi:MAG: iron ABC transporter permease [Hyphomicrobiales bacterium]|nr:iron ABC transporter permease [Hyphomicrobiales bacterium]